MIAYIGLLQVCTMFTPIGHIIELFIQGWWVPVNEAGNRTCTVQKFIK